MDITDGDLGFCEYTYFANSKSYVLCGRVFLLGLVLLNMLVPFSFLLPLALSQLTLSFFHFNSYIYVYIYMYSHFRFCTFFNNRRLAGIGIDLRNESSSAEVFSPDKLKRRVKERFQREFRVLKREDSKEDESDPTGVTSFIAQTRRSFSDGVDLVLSHALKHSDYNGLSLTKQGKLTLLRQFLLTLGVLRDGGNLVLRVGHLRDPLTLSIALLCFQLFFKVSIYRPQTDTQDSFASPYRYLVCKAYMKGPMRAYVTKVRTSLQEVIPAVEKDETVSGADLKPMLDTIKKLPEFGHVVKESTYRFERRELAELEQFLHDTMFESLQVRMSNETHDQLLRSCGVQPPSRQTHP